MRDEFEDEHCGSYERIYPSPDFELQSKYIKLLEYAVSRHLYTNRNI